MGPPALILALLPIMMVMEIPQTNGHLMYKRDLFLLEHTIDLRLSAFDDQYKGCEAKMEQELPSLIKTEFAKSKYFYTAWKSARSKWENRTDTAVLPSGFREEHAIAIMAYTSSFMLHKTFDKAVREAGKSAEYYQKNFKYKSLHFLLTRALQILEAQQETPQCVNVYRGFRDIRYKTETRKRVRFGQFISSSLSQFNGFKFGQHTVFDIETCFGVNIKNFSSYPENKEVLIPPYEKFIVTNFTRTPKQNLIQIHSVDKLSFYNCEYFKAKKCTSWKCLFNSGASRQRPSSLLMLMVVLSVLLLAAQGFP
ncbi:GPI-linked NAD(P)(+)--arginine ADP-ribosyltransferase 1-like [Lissotriton helveticus]